MPTQAKKYVTVRAETLALAQLERAAEHAEQASRDTSRLLDAVRCLHLSIISALTAALTDTAGLGALDKVSAKRAVEALDDGDVFWDERTMHYAGLLKAAQETEGLGWGGTLHLSPEEQKAARSLDQFRKFIDHPKPTSWSLPVDDLRNVLVTLAPVVPRALTGVWHRLKPMEQKRLRAAATALEALAAPPRR